MLLKLTRFLPSVEKKLQKLRNFLHGQYFLPREGTPFIQSQPPFPPKLSLIVTLTPALRIRISCCLNVGKPYLQPLVLKAPTNFQTPHASPFPPKLSLIVTLTPA